MKKMAYQVVVCALAALSLAAQNQNNVSGAQNNVSGTWQIEYHDKNGKEVDTPVVTFLQNGGRIDGVFGNQHWRLEGTVVGDQVQFSFHPAKHPEITVKYRGALQSDGQIRGTMASEVQSGTFVAVKR